MDEARNGQMFIFHSLLLRTMCLLGCFPVLRDTIKALFVKVSMASRSQQPPHPICPHSGLPIMRHIILNPIAMSLQNLLSEGVGRDRCARKVQRVHCSLALSVSLPKPLNRARGGVGWRAEQLSHYPCSLPCRRQLDRPYINRLHSGFQLVNSNQCFCRETFLGEAVRAFAKDERDEESTTQDNFSLIFPASNHLLR